ncbi:MAG: electron transport complex subunit RsxE [Phycisphaerales bacterium]|jgi:Na+-translocating ferredoxin:NAD+ oxidoreductase subunit E|nr:electron transport complex subunit RsxE [Phycisphaerales bacterium]
MANDGPTSGERFLRGLIPENPVYRQLLGMCPTLAVTGGMKTAMTMAGAVAFVLLCANVLISLIRPLLKPHLRILVFTLTIATFVTIADKLLAAFMPDMSDALGAYIPLIIVNCVIICRCEVCASKQSPLIAASDAVGQSLGFAMALASVASIREILGSGTFFGMQMMPQWWPEWGVMVMPPGAFLTLGLLLGLANWIDSKSPAEVIGGLRITAVIIALSVSVYGLAAQFINVYIVKGLLQTVDPQHMSEYAGVGFRSLLTSHLTIAIPAICVALVTLLFKSKFKAPYVWFGKNGRIVVMVVAITSIAVGALCGWPLS